jgi:hypothetical protein
MDTLQWVIFSGIAILGITLLWFGDRSAKRKRRVRFQDRPEITEDEFFSMYYKESGIAKEIVSDVLRRIANATEISALKIRPSDRFDRELAPVKGWEYGDGLAEISWFVKDKKKEARVRESVQLHTVDDLIRYVARLETQKSSH